MRFVRHRCAIIFGAALLVGGCRDGTSGSAPAPDNLWQQFSGEKALTHVEQLVALGPRPPASDAIVKAREYITKQLQQVGWEVTPQPFTAETPRGRVEFVNLIAHLRTAGGPASAPSFLLCSHYDTKTFDTARFVGANDGGSSSGLLIELARVLAMRPELGRKLELVFFDGEEAYEAFTETDGLFGSRFFAEQLVAQHRATQYRGGILFDMIGDRSLTVTLSPDSPPQLAQQIFAAASAVKFREHFTYFDSEITDDHTPLNAAGIPVIDLIDFEYPPWHTPEDTMDKLSAESLRIVGAVATEFLCRRSFE